MKKSEPVVFSDVSDLGDLLETIKGQLSLGGNSRIGIVTSPPGVYGRVCQMIDLRMQAQIAQFSQHMILYFEGKEEKRR